MCLLMALMRDLFCRALVLTLESLNAYHARSQSPILVDEVDKSEGDGEEAEEQVGHGQVGDEHVPGCRRHLRNIT